MVVYNNTVHCLGNSALISSGQYSFGAVFSVRGFSNSRKCIFVNNIIKDFV